MEGKASFQFETMFYSHNYMLKKIAFVYSQSSYSYGQLKHEKMP